MKMLRHGEERKRFEQLCNIVIVYLDIIARNLFLSIIYFCKDHQTNSIIPKISRSNLRIFSFLRIFNDLFDQGNTSKYMKQTERRKKNDFFYLNVSIRSLSLHSRRRR